MYIYFKQENRDFCRRLIYAELHRIYPMTQSYFIVELLPEDIQSGRLRYGFAKCETDQYVLTNTQLTKYEDSFDPEVYNSGLATAYNQRNVKHPYAVGYNRYMGGNPAWENYAFIASSDMQDYDGDKPRFVIKEDPPANTTASLNSFDNYF